MTRKEIDGILAQARAMDIANEAFRRAKETPPVGEAPDRPCGRCHDGTGYEWHPVEGWVSVCCGAPPASEESPPWMGED